MANNIVPFNADALAAIEQFSHEAGTAGVQFLKFTKQGEFVYGIEESVVEEEDEFAVNMATLQKGWICWLDGQVAGEEMVPVTSGRSILRHELPEINGSDGWNAQSSIELQNLDTGDTLLFKSSSKGGQNALANLAKEFADQMKRGEAAIVPVVRLEAGSYKHSQYGKIFFPKFEVVDWLEPGEVDSQPEAAEPEPEVVVEEPTKRTRRARKTGGLKV